MCVCGVGDEESFHGPKNCFWTEFFVFTIVKLSYASVTIKRSCLIQDLHRYDDRQQQQI